MKILITIALCFWVTGLAAQTSSTPTANAVRVDMRNPSNTSLLTYYLWPMSGGDSGFVVWDGTSVLPRYATLGSGLIYGSGSISVDPASLPAGPTGPAGPAAPSPTINNNVSRTLNSSYTISSTLGARVTYSVNVAWSVTTLLSSSSSAFLEYSTNAGSSWNTVSQASRNLGALTLGLSGNDDLNVSGEIPPNALVRIRTTSTNSTVTYLRGQEALY